MWCPVTSLESPRIREWLEGAFKAPANVFNDCDAIAQVQDWSNLVRHQQNFAAVLLSHGAGMRLFLRRWSINGTRYSGSEFGHVTHIPDCAPCCCGRFGSIEAHGGDYIIVRHAPAAIEAMGSAMGAELGSIYALVGALPALFVGNGTGSFDLMERSIGKALGKTIIGSDEADFSIDCFPTESTAGTRRHAVNALLVLDGKLADAGSDVVN